MLIVLLVARSCEIFMLGTKLLRSSMLVMSCVWMVSAVTAVTVSGTFLQILVAPPRGDHDLLQCRRCSAVLGRRRQRPGRTAGAGGSARDDRAGENERAGRPRRLSCCTSSPPESYSTLVEKYSANVEEESRRPRALRRGSKSPDTGGSETFCTALKE